MCKKCSSEIKVKPKREKVEKIIEREINGEKYIGTYNNYLKAVKEAKEKRKSRVRISYKRTNLKITYQNKTQTIAEWSKELGVSATCISSRIKRGKTMEEVFYKGKLKGAKKENLKKDLKRERRKLAKVLNAIKLMKMYNSIGIKITEYRNK